MSAQYLSPKMLQVKNHLAVIPCGSLEKTRQIKWTAEELRYYVSYVIDGVSLDRMFGGLIFNPIVGREGHFIHPIFTGFGSPVEKKDWEEALNYLFHPSENIPAASQVAFEPIDIWVCIPYPDQSQTSFGRVAFKNLDFTIEDDRFTAITWWIQEFLKRWNKEKNKFPLLNFRGFVWQRETIHSDDVPLVKRVNFFIKSNKLLSMWLPNYGGVGVLDSRDYGFDACCVNPNYYGNTVQDFQWINNSSLFVRYYNLGTQINYGKGLIFGENHLVDYLNLGLPEYNNYLQESLVVYQIHNTTMREAYTSSIVDYIRLYSGIKGIFTKVDYPNISY